MSGSPSTPSSTSTSSEVDALAYHPHDICEAAVNIVLRQVNTIQYLLQSVEQVSGQPFTRDRIKCLSASPSSSGNGLTAERVYAGYMWRSVGPQSRAKDIVLLEEHVFRLFNSKAAAAAEEKNSGSTIVTEVEKTEQMLLASQQSLLHQTERNLRHELIHAFDDARGIIESADCLHQACSEIRAARLSGDCFMSQEARKGRFNFFDGGQKCVRRRAIMAVDRNPVCRGFSERAVETVLQKCYSDYEPFAAPIYAMGSYGDEQFPNETLNT